MTMKVVCVFFAMLLVIALGSEMPKLGIIEDNISYVKRGKNSKQPPGEHSGTLVLGGNSWKSIETPPVLNISKDDNVSTSSFQHGLTQLLEKDKIEEDMAAKNMRVSHNSSTFIHQSLFKKSDPRSIAAARTGFMIDCATEFVMDRLQLNKSDVTFDIMLSDQLAQNQFCDQDLISSSCEAFRHYRSSNGICNNLDNPLWGSTFRSFRRVAPPDYGNGVSSLRLAQDGQPLPSARLVSSAVNNIRPNRESSLLSVLHMTYGQFFDHDLTFAPLNKGRNGEAIPCCLQPKDNPSLLHPECAPIPIPADDPFYSKFDQTCMDFVRSAPAPRCLFGPREQMNEKTAYIDGSQVYGIDDEMMNSLRTMEDGLLIAQMTSEGEELLPANTDLANECNKKEEANMNHFCFRAGDRRVNEQVLLVLFHTVWSRHHNHLASRLKSTNPSWNDEKLFQETRRIVGAQLQHVTYNEYLPPIFGNEIIKDFKLKPLKNKKRKDFYLPDKSAAISAEFATAAFRFGHSQIAGHMERVDDFGDISSTEMSSVFMNPFVVYSKGAVSQLTRGEVRQSAGDVDPFFTPQVAGNLFKGMNMFGLDLVALNIQRGRDHGIASYTAVRNSCELSPIHGFGDLSGKMDDDVIAKLQDVYRHVDDIDLFVGGLAEHPIEGGVVGPTFACILLDQFLRLKEGDRYWYETNDKDTRFTKKQVKQIRSTTLAGVMCEVIPELKEIQAEPLKVASPENPILPCSSFPKLDLKHWQE
ncbi:peroxidase-like [Penaeus indicus]|uniref:peroxidase-like n=1 Tax=Penaeus indicus TaxID=29960 RepID=UPI00300C1F33